MKTEPAPISDGPITEDPAHPGKSFFVYCLVSSRTNSTYIGATVDVQHRLRQHNGELTGGAKCNKKRVASGETWRIDRYVSGFPLWTTALSFEWRWKQLSRKVKSKNPLDRRHQALFTLFSLPQATKKAVPFANWYTPPKIHIVSPTGTITTITPPSFVVAPSLLEPSLVKPISNQMFERWNWIRDTLKSFQPFFDKLQQLNTPINIPLIGDVSMDIYNHAFGWDFAEEREVICLFNEKASNGNGVDCSGVRFTGIWVGGLFDVNVCNESFIERMPIYLFNHKNNENCGCEGRGEYRRNIRHYLQDIVDWCNAIEIAPIPHPPLNVLCNSDNGYSIDYYRSEITRLQTFVSELSETWVERGPFTAVGKWDIE